MGIIIKLSKDIIAKVAAGEVIEHPAAAVKELIENSLDAHATQIDIEIDNFGLNKIKVTDNGIGMSPEDLELCAQRHTTSKLKDLATISTLGFRGEALYSISTISKTTIRSKQKDVIAGHSIEIRDGRVSEVKPLGMPEGTSVIITDLFYNMPVRKNFYENKASELKRIIKTVTEAAISNHRVGFRLKTNNKLTIHLPKNQEVEERINYLLGIDVSKTHLQVNYEQDEIKFFGHISKPQHAISSREMQYLLVNNRPIRDTNVSNTIKKSFENLIDAHAHPTFVLYINIPTSKVDVNVHPRKREVLFINSADLHSELEKSVKSVLGLSDLTYQIGDFNESKKADEYVTQKLKEETKTWNIKTDRKPLDYEEIMQIQKLYLLFETKEGLTIIDQHAAHERILYEEFLQQFIEERSKKQVLKVSKIIELPVSLIPLFEENIQTLEKIGFKIEQFRKNSFKLTQIPEIYNTMDLKNLLIELLDDISKLNGDTVNKKSLQTISYLACRSAIKGGDYLTQEERKNLVTKLEQTKTKYTCPHGRPVRVDISKKELDKIFKRLA